MRPVSIESTLLLFHLIPITKGFLNSNILQVTLFYNSLHLFSSPYEIGSFPRT